MALTVEIDKDSGFCGGVIRAITSAEEYLDSPGHNKLFSLGPIVHNERELARLEAKGLVCIDSDDLKEMRTVTEGETLFIRAHGEPPETYEIAHNLGFKVKDCTCPVVLKLQQSILEAYGRVKPEGGKIIIYGKIGHAEVLGLVGQVQGDAIVVENLHMLEREMDLGHIDFNAPVEIFSQTTKNPDEYDEICSVLKSNGDNVTVHDTICKQVKTRHSRLADFAAGHDIIIFVAGKLSSNGRVLCDICKSVNIRTYKVDSPTEINADWFLPDDRVGVCGATSTPKWLLEDVASAIENFAR